MRQVFLSKSGQILVEEAPAPEGGPGMLRIAVTHSVISTGTETAGVAPASIGLRQRAVSTARLVRMGVQRLRERGLEETLRKAHTREGISSPLGYSVTGTVLEVGDEVSDLQPGVRVAAAGGAYAQHAEEVCVPRNLVVAVPDAVPPRAAGFATVGAIALQGVRRAQPQVGETALVIGLGLIGQLTVQILAAAGCSVIGLHPRQDRVGLARSGPGGLAAGCTDAAEAEKLVAAATAGIGADVVLLCAGTQSSEPANLALRTVRQRGRVVVVGAVGMQLSRSPFYEKEVEFTISCSYGPGRYDPSYEEAGIDYPVGFVRWTENRNLGAFLDLVARGRVDVERLIASEHPIDDAAAAFRAAKEQTGSGVAVLLSYGELRPAAARTVLRPGATRRPVSGEVGIAVLGAGGFATSTLLPALRVLPGVRLRSVVTRSSASAAKVAQEFGAECASTDADEALRDPAVHAVILATRHDLHAPLALRALAAGKHVFCEKPMGIERGELEELREAASRSDLVFSVGYNRRYAPLCRRVEEALASIPGPRVVLYRVNAGSVPPQHWTLDPRVGGGRIVGEACHMLDLLLHWLGPEVVGWSAQGLPPGDPRTLTAQDVSVSLQLRDPKGELHLATLVYESVGSRDVPKERIEMHAGGGSLVLEDFSVLETHGMPLASAKLARSDRGHHEEMRLFIEAVGGKENRLLGVEESYRAADLALRIRDAIRS